jgi:alkanesulfonate monooxygenase SsuD/methylene tetrahydromethanopterin reductase-like flavin-dependent oxidoreductase (luciferase family)
MHSLAGYLPVRGYQQVFVAAGFGAAVELAGRGAPREELVAALPENAARAVGLVGDLATMRERIAEYAEAGLDEVAIVPATAGDPAGERTLTALTSPQ